jgi:hypothetical protein
MKRASSSAGGRRVDCEGEWDCVYDGLAGDAGTLWVRGDLDVRSDLRCRGGRWW